MQLGAKYSQGSTLPLWPARPAALAGASLVAIAFLTASPCSAQGTRADRGPNSPVEVQLDGGALTVRAENASLADVLREIADAAGVKIVLSGDLSTPVSLSIGPVPMDQGIRNLVGAHKLIMIHESRSGASEPPRLTQLRVYGPTGFGALGAGGAGAAGAFDRIKRDLNSGNPGRRGRAIAQAAKLESEEALKLLEPLVEENSDATVRMQAVSALGRIGGEGATDILTRALSDPELKVRVEVIQALGATGGPKAMLSLAQLVAGEEDSELRSRAVQVLAADKSEHVTAILKKAVEDPDDRVREAALAALEERG